MTTSPRIICDTMRGIAQSCIQQHIDDPCDYFKIKEKMTQVEYAQILADANYAIALEYGLLTAGMTQDDMTKYALNLRKIQRGIRGNSLVSPRWDASQRAMLTAFARRLALSFVCVIPSL